jgi:hypothetical protein
MLLLSILLLAACASGPKKRVFPPEARLQELQIDDAQWRVRLRLHNYSNVPMTFDRVEASIQVDGHDAGSLSLQPRITVAANSVELLDAVLAPSPAAARAAEDALARGIGIGYRVSGTIAGSEPRGSWRYEFASRLDGVPGLERVLR